MKKTTKPIIIIALILGLTILWFLISMVISVTTINPGYTGTADSNSTIADSGKWYDHHPFVTHALGTDGTIPYNCLEGFQYSYDNGARIFECDLGETSDHRLVLSHSVAEAEESDDISLPTFDEFMNTPIEGGYTPMSLEMLIEEMLSHEDMYLITDFKSEDSARTLSQMAIMVSYIKECGHTELLSRIIPQFYAEEELPAIKELADFGGYIFTLYKRGLEDDLADFEEVASFCQQNSVDVIVLKRGKWCSSFAKIAAKYGIRVYPHTVYNLWHLERNFRSMADGCYTDGLFEADYEYVKNLPPHWYEKAKSFTPCSSVSEAPKLYQKGVRCFKPETDAIDYLDFIAAHTDTYLAADFDENTFPALAAKAKALEVTNRLVVFLHTEGISATIEPYIDWCDTVYDAHEDLQAKIKKGKTPAEALDSVLNKVDERGISVAAFDASDWQEDFYEVMKWHDCQIYINGSGIKNTHQKFLFWWVN